MEGDASHPARGLMEVSGDIIKSWIRWGIYTMVPYSEDCNKWSLVTS